MQGTAWWCSEQQCTAVQCSEQQCTYSAPVCLVLGVGHRQGRGWGDYHEQQQQERKQQSPGDGDRAGAGVAAGVGLEHTQLVHARFHEFYFIPYCYGLTYSG